MPDLADRPLFGVGHMVGGSRRRSRVGVAVAAVVIAAFLAGIWYVYDRGVRRGDLKALPVIQADNAPIKSSPTDAGGLKIPHVDGEMPRSSTARAGKVEDILPPPERPLPERPQVERAAPVEAPSPAPAPAPAEVAKAEPDPAPAPAPLASVEVAPRPAPQAAPVPQPAPPPAVAKETPKEIPAPAPQKAPEKVAAAPVPAAEPPAAAKTVQPQPAAITPAAGSVRGYRIQLAAVGEKAAAESEWRRLSRANADVLGKLTPTVATVDLPGKGIVHRLSAGPFPDRSAAAEACEALKKRKVGCFVVTP